MLNTVKNAVTRFIRDEEGASAVEYAIILALVAIVIIGFGTQIGDGIRNIFEQIVGQLGGGDGGS